MPNKKAVLVFSFMGYATQEIVVGERKVINVQLKDDSQSFGRGSGDSLWYSKERAGYECYVIH